MNRYAMKLWLWYEIRGSAKFGIDYYRRRYLERKQNLKWLKWIKENETFPT